MSRGSSILLHTSDSVVGIATRYALNGSGNQIPVEVKFSALVHIGPGAHPDTYTMGTGLFPGEKRPRRGVNHPCHLATRLNKEYSYIDWSHFASKLPSTTGY